MNLEAEMPRRNVNIEQITNEALSLPMYPELSNKQVEFVVGAVHNFYRTKRRNNNYDH